MFIFLVLSIYVGSALIANKIKAENAAWVNNASDAFDQISTAIVLKPVGLSKSVWGSSFMVDKNTRAAPANRPIYEWKSNFKKCI